MNYKIIDGVAYKCEEINLDDIRVEVNQAKAVIDEQHKKIIELNNSINEVVVSTSKQVENYKNQILAIQATIASLESKKLALIAPFENQKAECNDKITRVKEQLSSKKDIIVALLPDEAKTIGF